MSTTLVTEPSLLIRIRDAEDQESWSEFLAIYEPLIHRLASATLRTIIVHLPDVPQACRIDYKSRR